MAKLFYTTKKSYKPLPGQTFSKPSMTIQGETYSMKELIERYARGKDLVSRPNQYLDAESIDEITSFFNPGNIDISDLAELAQKTKAMYQKIEDVQKEAEAAQAKEEARLAEEQKEKELFEKFKLQSPES